MDLTYHHIYESRRSIEEATRRRMKEIEEAGHTVVKVSSGRGTESCEHWVDLWSAPKGSEPVKSLEF